MKVTAMILFILAAMLAFSGVRVVFFGENRPDAREDLVGNAIGAFLLPMICLIVGLILWQKARPRS